MSHSTDKERKQLLRRIESFSEAPMIFLAFVWLAIMVIELVKGNSRFLEVLGYTIWIIFILDFLVKFFLAPSKGKFIKSNVLTVVSLVVPAFRVFRIVRIFRILRFTRSLRLVRVIGSLNRSMRALSMTMKRRAFGYVLLLTAIMIFAGAAGMFAFENEVENGLENYGHALWWTAMLMTTLGSEYWPQTPEGRILCIFLAIYAFAVFGYITATIATFFIGRDAEEDDRKPTAAMMQELRDEVRLLREELKRP